MNFIVGDVVRLKTGTAPQIVVATNGSKIIARYLKEGWYNTAMDYIKSESQKHTINFDIIEIIETKFKTNARTRYDYVPVLEEYVQYVHDAKDIDLKSKNPFNLFDAIYDIKHKGYVNLTYMGATIKSFYNDGYDNKIEEEETTMTNKLYQVIGQDLYGTYLATNSKKEIVLEMRDGTNTLRAFKEEELEEVKPWTFDVKWKDHGTTSYSGEKDCVSVGDILIIGNAGTFNFGMVVKVNSKKDDAKEFQGLKLTGIEDFHSSKVKENIEEASK